MGFDELAVELVDAHSKRLDVGAQPANLLGTVVELGLETLRVVEHLLDAVGEGQPVLDRLPSELLVGRAEPLDVHTGDLRVAPVQASL